MNIDPFEQRLRNQTLRIPPPDYRDAILTAAAAQSERGDSILVRSKGALAKLFWPSPLAWAGLAAVCMIALAINLADSEPAQTYATVRFRPSPQVVATLKEQQRVLASLIAAPDDSPAELPKPAKPSPRSELQRIQLI
jgi:hypothetical protein